MRGSQSPLCHYKQGILKKALAVHQHAAGLLKVAAYALGFISAAYGVTRSSLCLYEGTILIPIFEMSKQTQKSNLPKVI